MDMGDSGEMTTQEAFEREGWIPFLSRTAALRFPEVRTTLGSLRNAPGTQMVIVGETTRASLICSRSGRGSPGGSHRSSQKARPVDARGGSVAIPL